MNCAASCVTGLRGMPYTAKRVYFIHFKYPTTFGEIGSHTLTLHIDYEKDIRQKIVIKKRAFAISDRKQKQLFFSISFTSNQMAHQLPFSQTSSAEAVSILSQTEKTSGCH